MTIEFSKETDFDLGFDAEETAHDVIDAVLDYCGCPYEAQVSVTFTDPESVRQINAQYRGIDRTTDVLSFPMLDYEEPGDFSFLGDEDPEWSDCFDPDSGELILGDIVLNMERTVSQAEEYGHSVRREFAFLIAHSMLHLMGYDHETPEDAANMEQMQDEILRRLHITRN